MKTISTDILEFKSYINEECSKGSTLLTPEEAVEKFRALQQLKEKLSIAEADSQHGKSHPLDVEAVVDHVHQRLAKEGITK